MITNEDQTLVIKENIEVDNYNAVTTYSDLGDEGLYLEIQYKDNSGNWICLLYTSDAADERSSVDLGGRRIIKKKKQ